MRLERINLQHVDLMPKELKEGVLYVAAEYGAAAHLCACGCGRKIRTPLHPTDWKLTETPRGPSLWPSVGNWQKDCQSHYIIDKGEIIWCGKWTPEQVMAGRRHEEQKRAAYYAALYPEKKGFWATLSTWLRSLFHR